MARAAFPATEFPAAQRLKQAYWLHSLQAALHEKQVAQAVSLLRSAGVEPLLAKGRAVARAYPELGLRPYGDIDLFVPPSQYVDAQAALSAPGVRAVPVDLHCGFADLFDLDDRTIDELYRRAEEITVGDVQVRILGAEDHLRFLCLHLLRHGLWRAIWLCDIGAILESQPADFDWGYFVSGDQRRSDWVLCVLNLAHQVVDAPLDIVPEHLRQRNPPLLACPLRAAAVGSRESRVSDANGDLRARHEGSIRGRSSALGYPH